MNIKAIAWIAPVVVLATIVAVFWYSSSDPVQNPNERAVATTIFPIFDIVEQVAGGNIEVLLIIPPGASPHTLDLSPSIARKIDGAEWIFAIGHGLDDWITASVPKDKLVLLDQNIELIESEEEGHEDGDEEGHREGTNPHYWLSPENAIHITNSIAEHLVRIDPENAENYRDNAENYREKLQMASSEWLLMAENIKGKRILTFHDAFPYLANFLSIEIAATVEPFPGREPTPQYLRELSQIIEQNNIQEIFLEPQIPKSSIRQFANDRNLILKELDPLGGTEGRMSYIELMDYNISQLISSPSE